jgi:23S rRNA pseudouridine1911/1915/1917 synthase
MQYKWRVKNKERGLSLENFIYKQLGDWSHSQVKKAIDHKRAFINGKNVFVSKWNLKPNDLVQFAPVENESPRADGGRYKFVDVLFEDAYIIVASKPAFVDYEDFMQTIQGYLKRKNKGQGYPYVGAMHRLDKETSGAMVFTKKKIANVLAEQFRNHTIQKFYLALVEGRVEQDEGIIKLAVEKGQFEEGKKVRVAEDEDAGKRAITQFRVVERYAKASLLRVQILTGRTHQIRIHMSHIGHPLVGDKLYGIASGVVFKRQALHAERLDFKHPVTNKKMKIVAPVPQDMQRLIDELRMQS